MESSGDDMEAYRERLDRIGALFAEMVAHAEVTSRTRCPYRDRHDLCTALFKCRNQLPARGPAKRPEETEPEDPERLSCGHDGTFDYRTAWEAHPRSRIRAGEKIARIKEEAESRRGARSRGASENGRPR